MQKYKLHFTEKESDLTIISESKKAIQKARDTFYIHRKKLEDYVKTDKEFLESFSPVKVHSDIEVVKLMAEAAEIANVGPMAAVAGALADIMLLSMKKDLEGSLCAKIALVENGGEIAIDSEENLTIGLYAGENPLSSKLGFLITKDLCPIGLGTSSATIGHAISLGEADAVSVFSKNAALGDALATRVANAVKGDDLEQSIKKGLDVAQDIPEVIGVFISRGDKIGKYGKLPQLVRIEGTEQELLKKKFETYFPDKYEIFE